MRLQSADQTAQWLRPLAIGVLATISVAVLYLGQVIFMPLALGIIGSFLLQPPVRLLERAGLPRIPSVIIVVFIVSVLLAGFGWGVGRQLGDLCPRPSNESNVRQQSGKQNCRSTEVRGGWSIGRPASDARPGGREAGGTRRERQERNCRGGPGGTAVAVGHHDGCNWPSHGAAGHDGTCRHVGHLYAHQSCGSAKPSDRIIRTRSAISHNPCTG